MFTRNINFKIRGLGLPIVLLHGWGFDHTIWKDIACSLSANFKLYQIDLPGFGLTPLMMWEEFRNKLLEILPARFALVGWSLGGLYALKLCNEVPARVFSLLQITSSPYFIKKSDWPGVEESVFDRFLFEVKNSPQKTLHDFIKQQLKNDAILNVNISASIEGLELGLEYLKNWDLREELTTLKIPAYYIFGSLDSIVSRRIAYKMQKEYPHIGNVIIKGAAHAPFISHIEEFMQIFNDFFKR